MSSVGGLVTSSGKVADCNQLNIPSLTLPYNRIQRQKRPSIETVAGLPSACFMHIFNLHKCLNGSTQNTKKS